jgi:hypothetical protein
LEQEHPSGPQTSGSGRSPIDELEVFDPGDETQRNFRYQHAYGAVLLVQARLGNQPYVAIWCEQHEDLLAEREDGGFDGWQVKTRTPELGPWKLLDEPVVRSIGRFCELVEQFGDRIITLYFVSNTRVDSVTPRSRDEKRRARCPQLFLDHVAGCSAHTEIEAPFLEAFEALHAETGASAELLFTVLQRMRIILGPSRQEFDATLAFEHLGALSECEGASVPRLSAVRDTLIMRVGEASALKITEGRRHVYPLSAGEGRNPALLAKRVSVEDLIEIATSGGDSPPFRMSRNAGAVLALSDAPRAGSILRKKLERGGLDDDQIEDFADLARSAEYHLMREANRRPAEFPKLQTEVEARVLSECRQAYLRAKQLPAPYGESLMINIQDRLRDVAESSPGSVWQQDPACLIGVAALLTDGCRVWFSERFAVDEVA